MPRRSVSVSWNPPPILSCTSSQENRLRLQNHRIVCRQTFHLRKSAGSIQKFSLRILIPSGSPRMSPLVRFTSSQEGTTEKEISLDNKSEDYLKYGSFLGAMPSAETTSRPSVGIT